MSEPIVVRVTVHVHVTDAKALTDYARKQYKRCWDEDLEQATGIETAVMEALVLSNENPSPSDYGIEIGECSALILSGPGSDDDDSETDDERYTCECTFDDDCECGCISCRQGDHSKPAGGLCNGEQGCDGSGVLLVSSIDGHLPPAGWTFVQRCDLCEVYEGDEEAARSLDRPLDTDGDQPIVPLQRGPDGDWLL